MGEIVITYDEAWDRVGEMNRIIYEILKKNGIHPGLVQICCHPKHNNVTSVYSVGVQAEEGGVKESYLKRMLEEEGVNVKRIEVKRLR